MAMLRKCCKVLQSRRTMFRKRCKERQSRIAMLRKCCKVEQESLLAADGTGGPPLAKKARVDWMSTLSAELERQGGAAAAGPAVQKLLGARAPASSGSCVEVDAWRPRPPDVNSDILKRPPWAPQNKKAL